MYGPGFQSIVPVLSFVLMKNEIMANRRMGCPDLPELPCKSPAVAAETFRLPRNQQRIAWRADLFRRLAEIVIHYPSIDGSLTGVRCVLPVTPRALSARRLALEQFLGK